MKAALPLVALLLLGQPAALAQPQGGQDVVVRQAVNPAEGAVIGQRIALSVDVLFAGTMLWPPRVSVPDAPGIQTFRFETQGTTIRDRIDGRDYVGQRFEFAVYARRGGAFTLPAARVTLLDRAGDPVGTATGSPTPVRIAVPQGVDPSIPVIASNSVTLTETWSGSDDATLRPGDAIKRTIHREADDLPALAMQPIPLSAPDGVRVYPEPPLPEDRISRGSLTGRRTDTLTYVFERPGSYALPPVMQPWWNLRSAALEQANAAGRTITVAAAPASQASVRSSGLRRLGWTELGVGAAILALAGLLSWLAWRLAPRLRRSWRQARQRHAATETEAFRALLAAARSGQPAGTYRAYCTWRSRLPPAERTAAASSLIADLEAFLFRPHSSDSGWTKREGRALAAKLKKLRAGLRHRTPRLRKVPALPPLNPVSTS